MWNVNFMLLCTPSTVFRLPRMITHGAVLCDWCWYFFFLLVLHHISEVLHSQHWGFSFSSFALKISCTHTHTLIAKSACETNKSTDILLVWNWVLHIALCLSSRTTTNIHCFYQRLNSKRAKERERVYKRSDESTILSNRMVTKLTKKWTTKCIFQAKCVRAELNICEA